MKAPNTQRRRKLREGWYEVRAEERQLFAAGIYEWKIKDVAVYVGKSENIRSRMLEYPNNVLKLINGERYRLKSEDGFRAVHRMLVKAHEEGIEVHFSVLETCAPEVLHEREEAWIAENRKAHAGSGVEVLNRTKPRKKKRAEGVRRESETLPDRQNAKRLSTSVMRERSMEKSSLRENWYEMCADREQLHSAGIFAWVISGVGIYIGKSNQLDEILHYMELKVARLLNNGGPYREIYHRLCEAYRSETSVQFKVLELCDREELKKRKEAWVAIIAKEQGPHGLPIMGAG